MLGVLQEGDPPGLWEETFKSHTDTKPRGPEAISLDLSFPGVEHLYGLPQHADSFNLRSTRGVLSRPCTTAEQGCNEHAAAVSPSGAERGLALLRASDDCSPSHHVLSNTLIICSAARRDACTSGT